MSPRRHRGRISFALVAVLLILALFVLHGVAAGVAAFAAMLGFILACIDALHRQDADVRRNADRTGIAGWFGAGSRPSARRLAAASRRKPQPRRGVGRPSEATRSTSCGRGERRDGWRRAAAAAGRSPAAACVVCSGRSSVDRRGVRSRRCGSSGSDAQGHQEAGRVARGPGPSPVR
jgi:hypothetical protein